MSNRIVSIAAVGAVILLAACASDSATGPLSSSAGAATVSGSGSTGTTTSRIRIQAMLSAVQGSAFPTAHGDATWTSRGNKREFEMEIEDVRPGTTVTFFLDGVQVGAAQTADALRSARVSLSTELGDQVPASISGKSVEVRSGDAVIASGSFN
jgi:hypothetical protein